MSGTKIIISAGEVSGDEHGAALIKALKQANPALEVSGMGGSRLREAGVHTVLDSETEASVMGFGDVLRSLRKVLGVLRRMREHISETRPDLLILVDFPDFNLRLARHAHSLGIRVLYFIPPSVWAWRASRIELLRSYADRIALIYPFELDFYRQRGVEQAHFVGHPFCDTLPKISLNNETRAQQRRELGIQHDQILFTIFPGSRKKEIERHAEILRQTIALSGAKHRRLKFATASALGISKETLKQVLAPHSELLILEDPLKLLQLSDAALLKSGTSNLQAAFFGVPFSMFYKAPLFAEAIVRSLVRVKQYSIVNLIRTNSITELIQRDVCVERLAAEVEELAFNQAKRSELQSNLRQVVEALSPDTAHSLAGKSAYERTANLALQLL